MPRSRPKAPEPKVDALRQAACLNAHPERVTDPLFAASDFFDGRDLVQVKYEMVRRVRTDGLTVAESARAFGFSRPSFYTARASLQREGLSGLLPKKRGPRRAHKLSTEAIGFLREQLLLLPSLNSTELANRLRKDLHLQVHPRSIERSLARVEKKRR
jgi:transposase-like protein